MARYYQNPINRRLENWIRRNIYGDVYYQGKLIFGPIKLRNHLEKLFEPGMNWYNWGKYWEIDHVIPRKYRDPKNGKYHFKQIHSLKNLQPMAKWKNRYKSNRYIGQYKYIEKEKKLRERKPLPSFFYCVTPETLKVIDELKDYLSDYEFTFFNYLLKSYTQLEISKKVNKGKSQVGRDSLKLRKKIDDYLEECGTSNVR